MNNEKKNPVARFLATLMHIAVDESELKAERALRIAERLRLHATLFRMLGMTSGMMSEKRPSEEVLRRLDAIGDASMEQLRSHVTHITLAQREYIEGDMGLPDLAGELYDIYTAMIADGFRSFLRVGHAAMEEKMPLSELETTLDEGFAEGQKELFALFPAPRGASSQQHN